MRPDEYYVRGLVALVCLCAIVLFARMMLRESGANVERIVRYEVAR